MLISCPKCKAVYMVDAEQIPSSGKKFKCFNCEHIWEVRPSDLQYDKEPKKPKQQAKSQIIRPAQAVESEDKIKEQMFNKVSKDTKSLFSYDQEDIHKFRRKMQVFFTPVMRNSCILIFIFIFTFLIGYYNRYDVVRFVPQMKYFYDKMDLESLYKGKDLILKRINIKHLDKKGEHFIEVSGMLINSGKYKVELPPIKVSLINQDGSIEDSMVKKLTMPILASEFSSLFRILLRNTTVDAKTVKINFCTDIQSCEDTQTVADKKAAEKAQQKQIEEIIKQKRKMQNSKKR